MGKRKKLRGSMRRAGIICLIIAGFSCPVFSEEWTIVHRGDHISYQLTERLSLHSLNSRGFECDISQGDLFQIEEIIINPGSHPENGIRLKKLSGSEGGTVCPVTEIVAVPFPVFFQKFVQPLQDEQKIRREAI